MSITTKSGDDGKSRFGGRVVDKDSVFLEAMGEIDELMAVLGIIMMKNRENEIGEKLEKINKELYQIMGVISGYSKDNIGLPEKIAYMESEMERVEKEKGSIWEFLEAGKQLDEWLNWGRTVARRVERRAAALNKAEKIDKNILIYFNRLSDYLFTIARLN